MVKKSIILFILLLLVPLNSAKYISISTSISLENTVMDNETRVNVQLTNSGDESAYDVQLSLILPPDLKGDDIFVGELKPGMPYKGNFTVSAVNGITPGKYTMGVVTDYKDANGYQFSSVSPNSLIVKKPTSSIISARISEIELGDKETKKVSIRVRNLDDKTHNLNIKFYLPRELKTTTAEKSLTIDPQQEKQVEFDISSFGALVGSSYVVFASLDYEENNLHYSSIASGVVRIVEKKNEFDFSGWVPIAIVVVLIAIFVFYQFIFRKNTK